MTMTHYRLTYEFDVDDDHDPDVLDETLACAYVQLEDPEGDITVRNLVQDLEVVPSVVVASFSLTDEWAALIRHSTVTYHLETPMRHALAAVIAGLWARAMQDFDPPAATWLA